jgi:hypothetical protein
MEAFLWFAAGSIVTIIVGYVIYVVQSRTKILYSLESTALVAATGGQTAGLQATWHGLPVESPTLCKLWISNKRRSDVSIADFQDKPIVFRFKQAKVLGFIGGPAPDGIVSETEEDQVIIHPSHIEAKRVFAIDFMIDGVSEVPVAEHALVNVDVEPARSLQSRVTSMDMVWGPLIRFAALALVLLAAFRLGRKG